MAVNLKKIAVAALAPLGLAAAAPAVASADVSPQTNGCVTTTVSRDSAGYVKSVSVKNACSYTLTSVDAHVYNGPADIDRRSQCCYNLAPGQSISFGFIIYWDGPKGSLTCGEIWGPNNKLWGRDCRVEP